jgi:hypothetical protein
MAVMPVLMVGSGTGAQSGECRDGRALPVEWCSFIASALTPPTMNMQMGIFYLNEKRYADAISAFKGIIEKRPLDERAWYRLGTVYFAQAEEANARRQTAEANHLYGAAVANLRKAKEINPQFSDASYNLGLTLLKLGKTLEAQKEWERLSFGERARYLLRTRDFIVENVDRIVEVISKETGKTRMDALSTEVLPTSMAVTYYAKKAAEFFGFKLKIIKIKLEQVEDYLRKIIPLIEDSNVVKVGVALPFYLCCEEAKKDPPGEEALLNGGSFRERRIWYCPPFPANYCRPPAGPAISWRPFAGETMSGWSFCSSIPGPRKAVASPRLRVRPQSAVVFQKRLRLQGRVQPRLLVVRGNDGQRPDRFRTGQG